MKHQIVIPLVCIISACVAQPPIDASEEDQALNVEATIVKTHWQHGSASCDNNTEPAHDVYRHDKETFIIRQNKCLTFEAPFIYILVGEVKILILDTGAISESPGFSFSYEIENLLGKDTLANKELIVVHSHSHSDHYQGDETFKYFENVTLVEPAAAGVHEHFGFSNWPNGQRVVDLGGRKLTIIPTPGHQEEAISLYDDKSKWLMTGDTLYPGYIYVKDWESYRNSIDKLVDFTIDNEVSAILGAHIEMKKEAGLYYSIGSTYQPAETSLALSVRDLRALNRRLNKTDSPTEIVFNGFIIKPMNWIQRSLSNAVRWVKQ